MPLEVTDDDTNFLSHRGFRWGHRRRFVNDAEMT
jgi:hypothetical protein